MNPSKLRRALADAHVEPVKTLGQNFLHDQNLARAIVAAADLSPEDFVVEIGPGLGALTEQIMASGARVLALEKDARLVAALEQKIQSPRFEVRHLDALDFDLRPLFAERNVKIIGNLPYYIASQLLLKFTEFPSSNTLSLFMLQDEMARRLSARPRSPDYGALSVRLQLQHRVDYLRKIPATVFFPQPDVESAIVRITPRDERDAGVHDFERTRKLVRLGFSQRRKQLRKLLRDEVTNWDEAAREIGAEPTARAEELSREQWIALAKFSAPRAPTAATEEMFPVVDERDEQISTASRREVHENNLRHRAVHILLFNDAGALLLQKRSASKDRHPLCWDSSAAGHVDEGESYAEAARRELMEELGTTTSLELIAKLPASIRTGEEFICLYRGECNDRPRFAPDEISAVDFFPTEVVERWIANKSEDFAPGFLECWKRWKESAQANQLRRG